MTLRTIVRREELQAEGKEHTDRRRFGVFEEQKEGQSGHRFSSTYNGITS
jgi:hypothetical protein